MIPKIVCRGGTMVVLLLNTVKYLLGCVVILDDEEGHGIS